MTTSPKRLRILKIVERMTTHGSVPISDAVRAIGGTDSSTRGRIYELVRSGFLQKHKQPGAFCEVALTEKGLAALAGEESLKLSEPVGSFKVRAPQQKISDQARRALYRSARYGNFTGRTIVDNRPVSRPPTLEGYGTSEVI